MNKEIVEYRGITGVVIAEITSDTEEKFETGEVKNLAGTAELSRETESANSTKYYDNKPALVISSTGADTVNIQSSVLSLPVLAEITGQTYVEETAMLIEGERTNKYFALGYETEKTNGDKMYTWRLKGTFNTPSETHQTKNDGAEGNGQELQFTGIATTHKFEKTGKGEKAITVDVSAGKVDVTNFFNTVQTPDTIKAKGE